MKGDPKVIDYLNKMACGSGKVLADMMSGRKPDIDVSELVVSRYEQRFG